MCPRFSVNVSPSNVIHRILYAGFPTLVVLLTATFSITTLVAQNGEDPLALEFGKPIERELQGGQAHSHRITLAAGQYIHTTVERRGIDVVITLFDAKAVRPFSIDDFEDDTEEFSFSSEAAGNYQLRVQAVKEQAASRRYEIKVEFLRMATEQDRKRTQAEQLFREGEELRIRGDNASLQAAAKKYQEALSLFQGLGDQSEQADALYQLGSVAWLLDENLRALEFFSQALALRRTLGDNNGEIEVLKDLGKIYEESGEIQKALDSFNRVVLLARQEHDRGSEASGLRSLGRIYDDLDEMQKATDFYEQSLTAARAAGDRREEAYTLNKLGGIYRQAESYQKAVDFLKLALALGRETNERRVQVIALDYLGGVYDDLDKDREALEYYQQALTLARQISDHQLEAAELSSIAWLHYWQDENDKAYDFLTQELAIDRALILPDREALALYGLARIESERGNLSAARSHVEATLNIIESLRTKIGSHELRSSFLAGAQDYYQFYIDLLMRLHRQQPDAGYDGKALQASERGRARSLLETLAEANADIRQGIDTTLLARERTAQEQLSATAKQRTQLLSGPHTEVQTDTIAKEIERLTTELQQVEAQIRLTSPRYAALTQPQPLTLNEIQTQVLDADTVLLEYSLGDERSYLWAVTPTSIMSYELPKRDEIEGLARQAYAQLKDKTSAQDALQALRSGQKSDPRQGQTNARPRPKESKGGSTQTLSSPEGVKRLSQILLGPVAGQLGNKRLLIVAEGALQYIPFGALPSPTGGSATDNYRPLIVEHEIVSLPSASTLAVLRQEVKDRKPAPKTVAVLADPVFETNDERLNAPSRGNAAVSNGGRERKRELRGIERAADDSGLRSAGSGIPRLPGTREEARQILALVPATEGKQALDFSASRQTATSGELSQYRYIHFATHGFLDSLHPELSGIVFSMVDESGSPQDGFLRAHEVFNLKLPAELVVLSACQTGLGKEVRGEGLVGLTRGFMYAGAPRVVVSLWSVNDQATAELMARFYRGMLRDKLRPAAALRAAQVSLMKEKGWQSPFYWAAFTMQGEWR